MRDKELEKVTGGDWSYVDVEITAAVEGKPGEGKDDNSSETPCSCQFGAPSPEYVSSGSSLETIDE